MQYILEEEEYNALLRQIDDTTRTYLDVVQRLCTEVAIHKPIKYWGNETALPWGCILEQGLEEEDIIEYCDECPVEHLCPNEYKEWSK